jgi:hypothetical protein
MSRWTGVAALVAAALSHCGTTPIASIAETRAQAPPPRMELVVRILDVGQGDATLITNGTSKVLIDGGPDPVRFGTLLDSLGLEGATIDVVILSHQHYDHHAGLRELFRTSRGITVRYFFENQDPYTNAALSELRDSVAARAGRGQLVYRDTDDPCGDGRFICTITMTGGAKLHVMQPDSPAPTLTIARRRSSSSDPIRRRSRCGSPATPSTERSGGSSRRATTSRRGCESTC